MSSFFVFLQDCELRSLSLNSTDRSTYLKWQMGATSSCMNDIANDDFVPILRIDEYKTANKTHTEDRNLSLNEYEKKNLSVPAIRTSQSDTSISNILDLMDTNNETLNQTLLHAPIPPSSSINAETKPSRSEISISFFLDRENNDDAPDEGDFANIILNQEVNVEKIVHKND